MKNEEGEGESVCLRKMKTHVQEKFAREIPRVLCADKVDII